MRHSVPAQVLHAFTKQLQRLHDVCPDLLPPLGKCIQQLAQLGHEQCVDNVAVGEDLDICQKATLFQSVLCKDYLHHRALNRLHACRTSSDMEPKVRWSLLQQLVEDVHVLQESKDPLALAKLLLDPDVPELDKIHRVLNAEASLKHLQEWPILLETWRPVAMLRVSSTSFEDGASASASVASVVQCLLCRCCHAVLAPLTGLPSHTLRIATSRC